MLSEKGQILQKQNAFPLGFPGKTVVLRGTKSSCFSMFSIGKKGQISSEYLLITGFILVIVTIIFSYSFISNNQNIAISQANTALDKMANAADLVYALGPENTKFIDVVFPVGTELVQDITVCNDTSFQNHDMDCSTHGGVKFGGIKMQVSLLGGRIDITRPVKAEPELDTGVAFPKTDGVYRLKVYWCGEKICLQEV